LSWAQRLKRVFAIDIEVCRRCGGKLRVIASIERIGSLRRPLVFAAMRGMGLMSAAESIRRDAVPFPTDDPFTNDMTAALTSLLGTSSDL
jgi:hypothetical protein